MPGSSLSLWLLERPHPDLDEISAFVICAPNEDAARLVAVQNCGLEGGPAWASNAKSSIRQIATETSEPAGVVLRANR